MSLSAPHDGPARRQRLERLATQSVGDVAFFLLLFLPSSFLFFCNSDLPIGTTSSVTMMRGAIRALFGIGAIHNTLVIFFFFSLSFPDICTPFLSFSVLGTPAVSFCCCVPRKYRTLLCIRTPCSPSDIWRRFDCHFFPFCHWPAVGRFYFFVERFYFPHDSPLQRLEGIAITCTYGYW